MIISYRGIGIDIRSSAEWSFLYGCLKKQSCLAKIGNTYIKKMRSGALSIAQDGKETRFREFGAVLGLIEEIEKFRNKDFEDDRHECIDIYDKSMAIGDRTILKGTKSTFTVMVDMIPGDEISLLGLGLIDMANMVITFIPDEYVKMYKIANDVEFKIYRIEAQYENESTHEAITLMWDLTYDCLNPIESKLDHARMKEN